MFLRRLAKYDLGLNCSILDDYFPGRKEQVDRMKSGGEQASSAPSPNSLRILSCVASTKARVDVEPHPADALPTKKILYSFLDESQPGFHKRLNGTLRHMRAKSSRKCDDKQAEGAVVVRSFRGDCVLCCSRCDRDSQNPNTVKHTRRGRSTVNFCAICQVYLCKKCWDTFHNDPVPQMPPCINKQLGLRPRRVLRYDQESPAVCSPVRTVITRHSTSKKQQFVGKSAARRIIGEKLRQRAAAVPDVLTATTPRMVHSPMKSIRQIRAKQVPRLKPNILAVQTPGFGGAKRRAATVRRTGTKRPRKSPRTSG